VTDTQPDLPAGLLDQLIDTGNKALNDYYHERACSCSAWPGACATVGISHGQWDTDAFAIALPAIIVAYKQAQPKPDRAKCTVCHRTYRTRADGQVRAHSAPRSIHRCDGSPTEEAELAIHPAIGTCTVCDREYHLTKTGKVWVHNNPTLDTTSGSYGLRCSGAGKPAKES
jgi:hypothetical protein